MAGTKDKLMKQKAVMFLVSIQKNFGWNWGILKSFAFLILPS